ncbi:MAG: type II toxin-antitoxin system RelE/ParE family toxin [Rhizomicrobium sp.]
MKVIIRASAYTDLEAIYDWIAKDNPEIARSVVKRIHDAVRDKIIHFPLSGRKGRSSGTREWPMRALPYIIVYKVDARRRALTVLGVVHGRRNR